MPNSHKSCKYCKQSKRVSEGFVDGMRRFFCDEDHAAKWVVKELERKRKKQRQNAVKKAKAENKQKKIALKADNYKHQLLLTEERFRWLVRELDKNKPCATCGKSFKSHGVQLTAGHYRGKKATPELRLCFLNCHGQCATCNNGRQKFNKGEDSTTRQKFQQTIVARYGQETLDCLDGPHPMPNYTIDELKAMRKLWAAEARRLEKGLEPSRDWRRA